MVSAPEYTSSTHRSALVRGTHQFQIVGYGVRKVSNPIRSGDFLAGGHTWALACEFGEQGDDHLASITLEMVGNSRNNVVAMVSLRIDDPRGRWQAALWRSDDPNVFSKTANSWKLTMPDSFRGHEARYVENDRITILCTVDVLKEEPDTAVENKNRFVSVVPSSHTLSQDLAKLIPMDAEISPRGCVVPPPDVTFVVEHTEIKAHKLVLAMRSPVLITEFALQSSSSSTTVGACVVARIDDMSASTFKAMLRFIYTDELPLKSNINNMTQRACKKKFASRCLAIMARDLLVAADRYGLERLRLMCEKILSESLDVATVMATLLAVRCRPSCRQLEESCIEYIASHPGVYAAVKRTEEYEKLKETCSALIIEITDRAAMHSLDLDRRSPDKSCSTSTSMYNVSEVVRGVHDFKIPNFKAVERSHGIGQETISGTFKVGGHEWRIRLSPSGNAAVEGDQYICVYLQLVSDLPAGTAGVKTSICFKIEDPSRKSPLNVSGSRNHTITSKSTSWGYDKFISLEAAKSKYLAHDGSLTVRCQVDVIKEPEPYTTSQAQASAVGARDTAITVPPSEISTQLEQLLASDNGSDVSFLVEESEIRAHRLVIAARSPVLHGAVVGTKEDDHSTAVARVDGMKAAVFKAVLHFIYTDELLPGDGTRLLAGDMLTAACRFGLTRLKAMCVNFVCESLTAGNVLATLKVAHRHHCKGLEDYCINFISSPVVAKEVLKTFISLED